MQDGRWRRCTDGNWRSGVISPRHVILRSLGHGADRCHVSCCAGSTCGSARRHKDTHQDHTQQLDHSVSHSSFFHTVYMLWLTGAVSLDYVDI